jgi:biopolymer transport protein TolR
MSFTLGSGSVSAEMNVTPLIDVLLVLLIIFLIITPMDSRGLIVDVPQQSSKTSYQDSTVVLQLLHDPSGIPSLSLNHQQLSWNNLGNRLVEIYKSRGNGVLFIKGDSDVEFEYVARVIDVAHNASVARVGLMP